MAFIVMAPKIIIIMHKIHTNLSILKIRLINLFAKLHKIRFAFRELFDYLIIIICINSSAPTTLCLKQEKDKDCQCVKKNQFHSRYALYSLN